MRNQLMVEEMLRVLGAAAAESRASVEQPELAAALLRRATLSYAALRDAGTPEARRRCERLAVMLFTSVWFGRILQAIELEDASVVYRVRTGHCGVDECCGPEPLLRRGTLA